MTRKRKGKIPGRLTSPLRLQWPYSSPCRGRTCCLDHGDKRASSLPPINTADRCLQDSHPLEITELERFFFNLMGRVYTPSPGRKRAHCLATHPHSQTHHTYTRGQACFGNEVPPEAPGMNSCTEGCVLWSQHLRRWEGVVGREGTSLRS